jgi:putative tryptophan/tyrosine transport system substrate-binding protein
MRRREFITLLGGAAVAWPMMAWAQERPRRIGVLMGQAATDPVSQARNAAFLQGLQELGWIIGRNVEIEYRWAPGGVDNVDNSRRNAEDLVALAPDVILATGGSNMGPLLQATRTVPIVFVQVTDPVGAGYVESLARPGGNATGFIPFEFGISGKWLELLKEIAPGIRRVAVLRDAALALGMGQLGAIQSVSPSFGVELRPVGVADADEIERGIATFARDPHGALILTVGPAALRHREMIIGLAARHKLPAVYPYRFFATEGGLVSYGPDTIEPYRRAAGYVDRILRGEKPADLPVQAPTKYDLTINLKTAKALGLEVPTALLARADEVIE